MLKWVLRQISAPVPVQSHYMYKDLPLEHMAKPKKKKTPPESYTCTKMNSPVHPFIFFGN